MQEAIKRQEYWRLRDAEGKPPGAMLTGACRSKHRPGRLVARLASGKAWCSAKLPKHSTMIGC